jgi:arylsulfatase
VLPLDSSVVTRMIVARPSITAGRNVFTWTAPLTGTPNGDAPSVLNASYSFKAAIEVPHGGGDGMLITQGGRFGGYGFYVLRGKPVFLWNLVDMNRVRWEGPEGLSPGKHLLEFDFQYDGLGMGTLAFNNLSGVGRGGTGVLKVDGKVVATRKMERTLPFTLAWDENLDVGSDTGTPVNDADYQTPFAFRGRIDKITLSIDRPQLSPADIQKLQHAERSKRTTE